MMVLRSPRVHGVEQAMAEGVADPPSAPPNEPENVQALQEALTETRTLTLTSGFPNTYLLKNGIVATIPIVHHTTGRWRSIQARASSAGAA